MEFEVLGKSQGPLLVCVPGLLGGADDFRGMLEFWREKYCIVIPDPNSQRRDGGLSQLSESAMQEISYDSSAEELHGYLVKNFPDKDIYFVGISLGGKIVYDFAIRYPDFFSGGVVTDVGPGSFSDSELFQLVDQFVTHADLSMPWPEMRSHLHREITDKNLRILVQTQIQYPGGRPPGIWKTGMKNFEAMLQRQAIDNQFEGLAQVDEPLSSRKSWIYVLRATSLSGISAAVLSKMKQLNCIKIKTLDSASHFLHITHKNEIIELVLSLTR